MDNKEQKKHDEFISLKKLKQEQINSSAGASEDTFCEENNIFRTPKYEYKITNPKTFKEKWQHFWHYHTIHIIVIIVAVALVALFMKGILFPTRYDIIITVVSDIYLDVLDENYETMYRNKLTEALEKHIEDYNGDGKSNVILDIIPFTKESETAAYTKLTASLVSGKNILFLLDDSKYRYLKNISEERENDFFIKINGSERTPIKDTVLKNIVKKEDDNGLAFSVLNVDLENKSEDEKRQFENQIDFLKKIIINNDKNED